MLKKFALLTLLGTLSTAQATQEKNCVSDRYFEVLPESESVVSFGRPQERALKPDSIKTLVWNIKKGELGPWQGEFLKYASNKDVVLVQEAYRSPLFDATLAMFALNKWNLGISFIYRKTNIATGTMVGSYVEPTEVTVKHSIDNEPFTDTPKSITMVKYPLDGRHDELLVISVHAINFRETAPFKRHIDLAAKAIKEHMGPVIFAGDFNTWNGPRTEYLYSLMRRIGMKTVDMKNADARLKFGGFPLDHGFTRGLEVKNAEVLPESRGSDHKPIMIEASVI